MGRINTFFVCFIAFLLWHPVFTPVHVEGFSATIQSIALHFVNGDLINYDRLFPFNLEFYYNSRFGMNLFVAGVMQGLPVDSEWAMRITMCFGFLLLVVSSITLIRYWANTDWGIALLAMVLLPGVSEGAFYFNDNILSSGLAVSALALCAISRRALLVTISGVLLGSAILTRPDNVILMPAIGLIFWMNYGLTKSITKPAIFFGLGFLSVMLLSKGMFNVDFFQTMGIADYAIGLWGHTRQVKWQAIKILLFLGIPGAIFIVLGVVHVIRGKNWLLVLLLVGVPIIYNMGYFGRLSEVRYLLPLTPFFCSLAVLGFKKFNALMPSARHAIFAICLLVMLAPTHFPSRHDEIIRRATHLTRPLLVSFSLARLASGCPRRF